MGAHFPDSETLATVLDLATRAPSADDAQPWRWQIGADGLDLFAESGASQCRDHRDVLLSCGASLHHCMVALAAMGWHARAFRLPDGADSDHLAALELVAQSPSELDVMLASAITRRRSDRRIYGSWPVPWSDIAVMGARAARAGVMLRQIDEPEVDGSVMVALGTESDDDVSRLRAGEATSLVLLSATAMGLASRQVGEALDRPQARHTVRADVFGGSAHPQTVVWMGWPDLSTEEPTVY